MASFAISGDSVRVPAAAAAVPADEVRGRPVFDLEAWREGKLRQRSEREKKGSIEGMYMGRPEPAEQVRCRTVFDLKP